MRAPPLTRYMGAVRIAIVASSTPTNRQLSLATGWPVLSPADALATLRSGDVALGRLDVLPSLDGVEDGLWALGGLSARGVRVINDAGVLLGTHDKLLTARLLEGAGLPHPSTRLVTSAATHLRPSGPVVVKPRFGSWGKFVVGCSSQEELARHLRLIRHQQWFRAHGALVQELIEPRGYDLRLVVAGGDVVGSIIRVCGRGEWRTNVQLGASRLAAIPTQEAVELAVEAARVTGGGLVGVDLLPDGHSGWTILEVNGAVDFTSEYSLEQDVFTAVRDRLVALVGGEPSREAAPLG